jgi:hypothetical protein
MAHATMKLAAGVNQNKTPALNEAAFSETNLVRFMPDKTGLGLVQKMGGWTKFYPSQLGTTIRALWAWEDSSPEKHLAVGAQTDSVKMDSGQGNGAQAIFQYSGPRIFTTGSTITVTGFIPEEYNGVYKVLRSTPGEVIYPCAEKGQVSQFGEIETGDSLYVITENSRVILTPTYTTSEPQTALSTVSGSAKVTVKDPGSKVVDGDSVYIKTQISVGGIIIFGTYPATNLSDDKYTITAHNILGAPDPADKTLVDTGFLPRFLFTTNSSEVTVILPDHGYSDGDTFPILVPVYNGSLKLLGNFLVSVAEGADAKDRFTIQATRLYKGDGRPEVTLNNGVPYLEYYRSPGPMPTSVGYGVGGYGLGGYGVGEEDQTQLTGGRGVPIVAKDWTLDNWADELISCPVDGAIYRWNPLLGTAQATLIPNAPMISDGMFVAMPQRQIVAWSTTFNGIQDPLLIRWCDVNNYNSWVATVTNQAGSFRISKGSRIVGGIQGPQQGLIWTDLAVWSMQYSGLPLVYQFTEIGTGCGLIGRKAAGSMSGAVFWMGSNQFFMLGGSGVQTIHCPVWDVVFQDLDRDNVDKIRFAANSTFGEVAWFFPTNSSNGEPTRYVKYNTQLDAWDYGSLDRTAWINQNVYGPPIGAGLSNYIYQHETSLDADGVPMNSWFQTGYAQMGEGEFKLFIDQVWPDFKWNYFDRETSAQLDLSFYVTDYPGDAPRKHGPYRMNKAKDFVSPRFRGRLVSVKVESSDYNSFWRIGAMRYRYTPDGKF